ncbi:hypothetical protein QT999_23535 [Microcoleus sp. S36b_A2]
MVRARPPAVISHQSLVIRKKEEGRSCVRDVTDRNKLGNGFCNGFNG